MARNGRGFASRSTHLALSARHRTAKPVTGRILAVLFAIADLLWAMRCEVPMTASTYAFVRERCAARFDSFGVGLTLEDHLAVAAFEFAGRL